MALGDAHQNLLHGPCQCRWYTVAWISSSSGSSRWQHQQKSDPASVTAHQECHPRRNQQGFDSAPDLQRPQGENTEQRASSLAGMQTSPIRMSETLQRLLYSCSGVRTSFSVEDEGYQEPPVVQHVLRLPSPAYTLVVLCGQVPQRLSGRLLWFHLVMTHVAQYQCALLVLLRDARRLDLEVPLLSGLILCCEDGHQRGLGYARRRL